MFLIGLGTALPAHRHTQRECWTAFERSGRLNRLEPRSQALLRKVLTGDNGITSRHLAVDDLDTAFELTPDVLHARFANHAPELATRAARQALAAARTAPAEIDAVLISTCTGYLCPGLTSYVIEQLGLRANVFALDLVGQGCGAAVPNLRNAQALLASGQANRTLSVCVEVCSAAFYLDNDPGVLISACLFGDGAAAVVGSTVASQSGRQVKWGETGTILCAEQRDLLRFEQRNGMLRNILAKEVPSLAASHVEGVLEETLLRAQVQRSEITGWILHAGGREVLTALKDRLRLTESDIRHSAAILRECGNISSPSVLFSLRAALAETTPGGWWWLSSFGAGFSCHGALLQVV